jgi:hypothetical protein
MEPDGLLPCLQVPAICPFPETDQYHLLIEKTKWGALHQRDSNQHDGILQKTEFFNNDVNNSNHTKFLKESSQF